MNMSMQKSVKKSLLALGLFGFLVSNIAFAESAASHASRASEHSLAASGHTAVSAGMSAVAVVEVPLAAIALAGEGMQSVGESLIDATHHRSNNHYYHGPLEITEITITVDPSPKEALKQSGHKD